ncbi:MAG: stage III sporulation protein AG [Oscillibacter sp.]|jgi:stage III sporulation protein AG|nr:stage III sporulation protein AG [Oscillibacter sp.]
MEREKAAEKFRLCWSRYKFVGLVLLIGIVLLLWPTGSRKSAEKTATPAVLEDSDQLAQTEEKMEQILSKIDGVGELQLMLTMETSNKKQLAADTELSYSGETAAPEDYSRKSTTVVVSGENGDEPIVTESCGPVYRGALVVCQGANRADVKLAVTQAVAALTGLGSDRISVVKCQS